jgi:hypothetical protein
MEKAVNNPWALHEAVVHGCLEDVRTVLKDNPDLVFSKDAYGWTPLHWAAEGGQKEVVELLLASRPAAVNHRDEDYGATPLHYAVGKGHRDVAELLPGDSGTAAGQGCRGQSQGQGRRDGSGLWGALRPPVVHEGHRAILLPRGNYRVTIQREYTPGEIRNVRD